jgi:hypothetical protein
VGSPCRAWVLLVPGLLAAGCRAFPVGLYVPGRTLDALERSTYDEDAALESVVAELRERGVSHPAPAAGEREAWFRLDREPAMGPFEPRAADRPGPLTAGLAPGDLVLVKNPKAQSLATTLCFTEPVFYDHLGVLVLVHGRWQVIDSWPFFSPLGCAEDFAARFRGGVRVTPLSGHLEHYETLLFVRLGDAERRAALAREALAALDEGIEYDPHHDPEDPRLSCSEFVQELLRRAGLPHPTVPRPVVDAGDLRELMGSLGFPTTGFLVPEQFLELPGARPVAWLSRHPTVAGARAVEVAFALLAARLRREGRVTDLLGIDRFRFLRYRRNVARFLAWAEALAEAEGWSDRERLERELTTLESRFFVR